MAWPANIAPQTPSAEYDKVDVYVGATPPDIYVQLINGTYATIKGAKSRCRIDLPLYDQSTERDEIWASKMGRSPLSLVSYKNLSGTYLGAEFNSLGDPVYVAATGVADSFTPSADEIVTTMQQSDSYTHVPPHQLVLGQTMIRWFDTAGATGNMVGEMDAAWYVDSGGAPPKGIF